MSVVAQEDRANNHDGLLTSESSSLRRMAVESFQNQCIMIGTWKAYWHSTKAFELLFSLSLLFSALVLRFVNPDPRQRAIPYQQLASTGEYIVNQNYDEYFKGDTFSGTQDIDPDLAEITHGITLTFQRMQLMFQMMRYSFMHCYYHCRFNCKCERFYSLKVFL